MSRMTFSLGFSVIVAAFGSGFQHGYGGVVVNPAQLIIEDWIRQLEASRRGTSSESVSEGTIIWLWSAIVSVMCIGGIIGGASTGFVAEKFGRRGGLILNNILVFVSVIIYGTCKVAKSYEMLIVGRLIIGINNGLNAGLCPMYLTEIAPRQLRGAIGTLYELFVNVGSVAALCLGLEVLLGTDAGWPYLFCLMAAPAILQMFLLYLCPETPMHLLANHHTDTRAREAMMWLRDTDDIDDDMDELKAELDAHKETPTVPIPEFFRNYSLRKPLIIAVVVMASQQLSGINAVMYYSTKIFVLANVSMSSAQYATLGVGVVKMLAIFVSTALVDRAGRKLLLLVGYGGMFVATVFLTVCLVYVETAMWVTYVTMVLLAVFVGTFSVGPGPIPWFLVDELFTHNARSTASSIAVSINWLSNFIVGLAFLPLQSVMGPYVFIIFVLLLAVFAVFVYLKLPETKGKSIEEITALFAQ